MRYWKFIKDHKINSVQSCSNDKNEPPGGVEIGEEAFNEYLASLPSLPPPEPVRDLATEIDELKVKVADYDDLKARVKELEKK